MEQFDTASVHPRVDSDEALQKIRIHWLSHIVHDLRGPIFAARGYAKLLLEERGGPVTVTQRRYLDIIVENISKLADSVGALSDFPSGKDLELELFDLEPVLHAAADDCISGNETLHISRQFSPGPYYTVADRAKLTTAVHKLLASTVEFSRCQGKIDLYAHREDGELTMRIAAPAMEPGNPPALPDIAMPCGILRLHGGAASADCNQFGVYNVTFRLPLIRPDSEESKIPSPRR